jgi:uncharacterized protein (TIGR00369 family)
LPGKFEDEGRCFVCGKSNPQGLRVDFRKTEEGVTAFFSADENHQGYRNIVHGGIIASLLDEASVKVLLLSGIKALTAEITLRYKKPLHIGEKAVINAIIANRRGRLYEVEAEIRGGGGDVIALSSAKLLNCGESM